MIEDKEENSLSSFFLNKMTTIKATRATIILGDIEIEGYQLPDGEYKVSTQTFKDTLNSLIGNSTGKKYLKPILEASESIVQNVKIEGYNRSITMYGLDTFSEVVACYAQLGNQKAVAILIACMSESLERRFDDAFGIIRTEQERNQKFIIRRDGILSRHFWTDTVDWWMKNHPEQVSDNYRRFVYSNVSDCLNRTLFGKTARQLLEHYDLPKEASPRDYFPSETLRLVDSIEKAVGVRVRKTGAEPKQALKEMLAFMGIEPDESLL